MTLLSGCLGQTTRLVSPQVPHELRQPVPEPQREVATLKDVTLVLVDFDEALTEANSRIVATDEILTAFEARIANAQ